jgi:uncharacterized protein
MPTLPVVNFPGFTAVSGTLLNASTVLIGALIGLSIGNRLPERIRSSLFTVLGLFTIFVGISNALKSANPLIVLGSLLIGTLIGEIINIDGGLKALGDWAQKRFSRGGSRFSEGFVTSSLIFCVGPLTILGSLENGLTGDTTKLAIKSVLDGFAAIGFAATLGGGVLLSVLTILVVQGSLSLFAGALAPLLGQGSPALLELTATGGVILIALGINLLDLRQIRAASMLPALLLAPVLVGITSAIKLPVH